MERISTSVTLIVLAAGHQPTPFGGANSTSDSGFLNVGTKLAIERIHSFFANKPQLTTLLAVGDANRSIYQLLPYKDVRVIGIGKTRNVNETLLAALDHVTTEWCLINPITAVPTSHLSTEGAVYFGQDLIPKENWSALTVPSQNQPMFHPKAEASSNGLISHPFTGRIYAQAEQVRTILREMGEEQKNDLIYLGAELIQKQLASIRYEKWIDAGHQATYAESKLHSISSRFFNSLSYNPETNTIRKVSSEATKLRLEAQLINEAPARIRRFFPAIVSSSNQGEQWEVEMEYVGYPSLAEVFLYSKVGPNTWKRIIDSLGQAYDAFYGGTVVLKERASWLYSEKTLARQKTLEGILKDHPNHSLKAVYEQPYSVNGLAMPSLRETYGLMLDVCHELERTCELHVGHGDMCFNNILVDPLFGTLKLIDPKAAVHPTTGQCGLMQGLYDLAKLNHSFIGLYDSVVNGLYGLSLTDQTTVNTVVYAPSDFSVVSRMFQDRLLLERTDELACTQATANLFLSMLPLHREDEARMVTLAIVGSMLLIHGTIKPLLMAP
ncbi:MAG: hypothetical protein ACOYMY_04945 [Prochlorococcaceae cyanobacterium]